MPVAYILINVDLGAEQDALKETKSINGVKEGYSVYGVYDIITKIESDTMDDLKAIMQKIRRLDKVRSTLTMIVIEGT